MMIKGLRHCQRDSFICFIPKLIFKAAERCAVVKSTNLCSSSNRIPKRQLIYCLLCHLKTKVTGARTLHQVTTRWLVDKMTQLYRFKEHFGVVTTGFIHRFDLLSDCYTLANDAPDGCLGKVLNE